MKAVNPLDKNIHFLITANHRRMMSFEQAAFLTKEASFKEFYLAKAEESEINIKQLYLMLNLQHDDQMVSLPPLASDPYLANLYSGKKTTIKILESVKTIEKSIAGWYRNTLQEIADLPENMIELVKEQYRSLNRAQLQLEQL